MVGLSGHFQERCHHLYQGKPAPRLGCTFLQPSCKRNEAKAGILAYLSLLLANDCIYPIAAATYCYCHQNLVSMTFQSGQKASDSALSQLSSLPLFIFILIYEKKPFPFLENIKMPTHEDQSAQAFCQ